MTIGLGFLHSVLSRKENLSFLQAYNLIADDFNEIEQPILDHIQSHIFTYGVLPSVASTEVECDIEFPPFPDEPPQYWADALLQRSVNAKIQEQIAKIQSALMMNNRNQADTIIREMYTNSSRFKREKVIVTLADLSREVMDEHNKRRKDLEIDSVPTGFPFLDEQTGGFQRGDFIAIVARIGKGKTYLLLRMALTAHEAGKSVLLVSTEMSPMQYARRLLALKYGISINRIRLGQLSTALGERTLEQGIEELQNNPIPFKVMRSSLTTTLEDVIIQVKEMKPDLVCIDGAYLLKSANQKNNNKFEIVSNSSETLKALAQEVDRPVVATYQIKRKTAGNIDDIYMSDSIAQISSIVLSLKEVDPAVIETEDADTIKKYRVMELLKGREGESGKLLINYDMDRMNISESRIIEDKGNEGASRY